MTGQNKLRHLRRTITDSPHPYVLYWAPACRYSQMAHALLSERQPGRFDSYRQEMSAKPALLKGLGKIAESIDFPVSHRTWPMVFYEGKFLGGYTELAEHLG